MVGGDMDLGDHAETMSLDGRSGGIVMPGLDELQRRQVLYEPVPQPAGELHPDYVLTHRIDPVTPGTSRVECQWLFPPEAVERPGFDPSYAVDFWDLTNRQDWAAVESVQRGVASPRHSRAPQQLGGRRVPLRDDGRRRLPGSRGGAEDGLPLCVKPRVARHATTWARSRSAVGEAGEPARLVGTYHQLLQHARPRPVAERGPAQACTWR